MAARLCPRRRHPIVVSPLDPPTLEAPKAELGRRWSMTGRLALREEAGLRIGGTTAVASADRPWQDRAGGFRNGSAADPGNPPDPPIGRGTGQPGARGQGQV